MWYLQTCKCLHTKSDATPAGAFTLAEDVCRSVCRSIIADSCQSGPLVRVSADKTTAPHGGRCIQIPRSRLDPRQKRGPCRVGVFSTGARCARALLVKSRRPD